MSLAYSEAFKAQMVEKLTSPGAPSASVLSGEVGVPQPTLSRWVRQAGRSRVQLMAKTPNQTQEGSRRPQDWAAEAKLAAVLEASSLDEEALGRFLREQGLHRATLERWREQMLQGLCSRKARGAKPPPPARRVRELERELRRKEKALAEASALLVLKKNHPRLERPPVGLKLGSE